MKVLIACEESQTVCKAFRELGHEAYSNDIIECSGGHPEWHLQMDCFEAIKLMDWDLMIAHPPCTHLAVSGAKHFKIKREDGRQNDAINFFLKLYRSDVDRIAIENPVGIMSSHLRKPDQIIQPYYFGDAERKTTCLWLKRLPKLVYNKEITLFEDQITCVDIKYHETKTGNKYTNIHNGMGFGWNTPECKKARSVTFPGIARAMAEQWGSIL